MGVNITYPLSCASLMKNLANPTLSLHTDISSISGPNSLSWYSSFLLSLSLSGFSLNSDLVHLAQNWIYSSADNTCICVIFRLSIEASVLELSFVKWESIAILSEVISQCSSSSSLIEVEALVCLLSLHFSFIYVNSLVKLSSPQTPRMPISTLISLFSSL